MFGERVHLKIGVTFYHVNHDRSPCDYVALLSLFVEVDVGADDVGTESARLARKRVRIEADLRYQSSLGFRSGQSTLFTFIVIHAHQYADICIGRARLLLQQIWRLSHESLSPKCHS